MLSRSVQFSSVQFRSIPFRLLFFSFTHPGLFFYSMLCFYVPFSSVFWCCAIFLVYPPRSSTSLLFNQLREYLEKEKGLFAVTHCETVLIFSVFFFSVSVFCNFSFFLFFYSIKWLRLRSTFPQLRKEYWCTYRVFLNNWIKKKRRKIAHLTSIHSHKLQRGNETINKSSITN